MESTAGQKFNEAVAHRSSQRQMHGATRQFKEAAAHKVKETAVRLAERQQQVGERCMEETRRTDGISTDATGRHTMLNNYTLEHGTSKG